MIPHITCLKVVFFSIVFLVPSIATAQRIISTDNFVTEMIFALGQQDSLVAVDVTSVLPPEFPPLPNIGYHRNLSVEGILKLKPDIIIGSEHIGPEVLLSTLQSAGVPLVQLPSATNSQQLVSNIQRISAALDLENLGLEITHELTEELKVIESNPLRGYEVAFILTMNDMKPRLAGRLTGGDALINLLGAQNVAEFKNYQSVSTESLLALDPDLILVAGRSTNDAVTTFMKANPALRFGRAARKERVFAVDASSLVSGLSISAINEALRIHTALPAGH